jgi:VWFA-related protein
MKIAGYSLSLILFSCLALAAASERARAQQQPQGGPNNVPQPVARPQQTPTPEPLQNDEEIKTFIREVRVPVMVLDKKGQPVTGLLKTDFQVFEDKQPQDFKFIGETTELEKLPIYVGVMMDTSASTAGKLKFEQEAALNFIYTVVRSRRDQVAFVTFDHEVNLRQDFTTNLDLLNRAVSGVKKPGTNTALFDAVYQFCDEKLRSVGASGRRVIVIITDGDDTYSRATLRDAIEIAQKTDTIIFTVSTKGGFAGSSVPGVEAGTVKDSGDRDLSKLSEETGGRAFYTGDILALERAFKKIGDSLRSQYLISYTPARKEFDGTYRRIDVKLANKGDGMKVQAKRGYKADRDMLR